MFTAASLRRRRGAAADASAPAGSAADGDAPGDTEPLPPAPTTPATPTASASPPRGGPRYFIVASLHLRLLGLVFLAAFAAALMQNIALLGERGLAPACSAARLPAAPPRSLAELWPRLREMRERPSLFLLLGCSDDALALVALAGAALALVPLLAGACNAPLLLALWACQLSLVNLGSQWYSFGWETQLCETALWVAMALPLVSLSSFDAALAPSTTALALAHRLLIAKIMVGAGLIKLRGDECWRDLWSGRSCMQFHFETQPSPNPLSPTFHVTPVAGLGDRAAELWHGCETLVNHVVELGTPLLLVPFLPRLCRVAAGVALVLFQAVLIASGNLSFLNWLTIVPAIFAFDDEYVARFFPAATRKRAAAAAARADELAAEAWLVVCCRRRGKQDAPRPPIVFYLLRSALAGAALAAYVWLQAPVVLNLLSPRQAMNRSFDAWHLSNTYGAFGSVGKVRTEISIVGTGADGIDRAYELRCHPGALSRRPCLMSPYHLRADWSAWFAGLEGMSYQQYPWTVHLVDELLAGGPLHRPVAGDSIVGALRERLPMMATDARDVIAFDPFAGVAPPVRVTVLLFEYRFTPPLMLRVVRALRLPAAAATPAHSFDSSAAGAALCAAVPSAWSWPVGDGAGCKATLKHADDGSGPYVAVVVSSDEKGARHAAFTFEVGVWWARRLRSSWLPTLEKDNASVRAFLQAHGMASAR